MVGPYLFKAINSTQEDHCTAGMYLGHTVVYSEVRNISNIPFLWDLIFNLTVNMFYVIIIQIHIVMYILEVGKKSDLNI